MVGGQLREVAQYKNHRLVCDGWAYYDVRGTDPRRKPRMVGYFEHDAEAIAAWLDLLEVKR